MPNQPNASLLRSTDWICDPVRIVRRNVITLIVVLVLVADVFATWIITGRVSERYPPQGRFVDVEGGRLHLIERGPARPEATILLVHGASSNAAEPMLALGGRLAERYRVIAIDRPGHGWSERLGGRADASPARQAALIAQVLMKENTGRVIVVAHSWAGTVGTSLALEHSDVVSGLVLLAPVSHPWPGGIAWYYHVASAPLLGTLFTWTLSAPTGSVMLPSAIASVFAPQTPPANYIEDAQVPLVLRPATFAANAEDMKDLLAFVEVRQGLYGAIDMPTTIITGDQDTTVSPVIHASVLAAQIVGARLVVMPGVGHQPQYADPALVVNEINAVVMRVLQRQQNVSQPAKP